MTSPKSPTPQGISARPPSKPWRVCWIGRFSEDHRSQRAAYDAVRSLTDRGIRATVYHWVSGVWVLYEHCGPVTAKPVTTATEED